MNEAQQKLAWNMVSRKSQAARNRNWNALRGSLIRTSGYSYAEAMELVNFLEKELKPASK